MKRLGGSIHRKNDELDALFLKSVKEGNLLMVETLLGFGANPNLRETVRHDSAVICIAYAKGYWEIVESLIKWGADTENIMDRETTPFP